ncbi:MAG: S-layer homology domain-containing protein [Saccharofermentans sp.]|nr:S-layer homology domain-containing protein [Saccharofermentans sp.]
MYIRRYAIRILTLIAAVLISIGAAAAFTAAMPDNTANAATQISPYSFTPSRFARLFATDDGYVRIDVNHDANYNCPDGAVVVEDYDDNFNLVNRHMIPCELPKYGGAYRGSDAYYLAFGDTTTQRTDGKEVLRIVKYDLDWNRLGSDSVTCGNTDHGLECDINTPFDRTSDMLEMNGYLYIVFSHTGHPLDGKRHQGYYMVRFNEQTMKMEIIEHDASHSFSQNITAKDKDNIYVLEENEGSYANIIWKLSEDNPKRDNVNYIGGSHPGDPYERHVAVRTIRYGAGRTSDLGINTLASADAIKLSGNYILSTGTSADQTRAEELQRKRDAEVDFNLQVHAISMNDFCEEQTTLKWETNTGDVVRYSSKLVKINNNRFLVMWQVKADPATISGADVNAVNTIKYAFIDGTGKLISSVYTKHATLSEVEPVYKNGKVTFYSSSSAVLTFYSIDATDGSFTSKVHLTAGKEARFTLNNGVLKISGSGEIREGFSYDLGPIADKVKEIIVGEGITGIGTDAFAYLKSTDSIDLPSSLKNIGNYILPTYNSYHHLKLILRAKTAPQIKIDSLYTYFGDFYAPRGSTGYDKGNWSNYLVKFCDVDFKVKIDAAHFPDNYFRQIVKDNFDLDKNIYLTGDEVCEATGLYLDLIENGTNIQDLTGIEYFTDAERIQLIGGKLKTVDLSKLTKLKSLIIRSNSLKSIDLSNNKELEILYLENNDLTELDISHNTKLESLSCSNNGLTALDISNNPLIKFLYCYDNQITQLDLGKNKNLLKAVKEGTKTVYRVGDNYHDSYSYRKDDEYYVLELDQSVFISGAKLIKLDKKSIDIICYRGATINAKAIGITDKIKWKSSNDKIATVDSQGGVTARMAGQVTITASAGGKKATCKVTVLYEDVTNKDDFWFTPTNYLTAKGVVKGYYNQTYFKPANECTRAQMLTFMWRLAGCPEPESKTCVFPDVKQDNYFYKPVIWAVEKGITTGYPDNTFRPQNVCTRAQTVTFLWRMAGKPDPKSTENKFTDVKPTAYYYVPTLWASEKKILAGYDDNTFRPQGKCLRRQMVTFLYKYDKYVNGN